MKSCIVVCVIKRVHLLSSRACCCSALHGLLDRSKAAAITCSSNDSDWLKQACIMKHMHFIRNKYLCTRKPAKQRKRKKEKAYTPFFFNCNKKHIERIIIYINKSINENDEGLSRDRYHHYYYFCLME